MTDKSKEIIEIYNKLEKEVLEGFTEEDRFTITDVKMFLLGAVTKGYYEGIKKARN
jgi:hypothetical protein